MSEHQSAARQALLADAAAQLGDGAAPAKVGDCESYLHCYYRHVDSSDLIAAGPRRVGAVAAAHAQLAALRPQGRAAVRVRPGADATLLPDRDVIDVVTDDMPFLVDTLTMTLAAHEVAPDLVVHPQLMVRRDVTGALREVIKPTENRPGDQPPDTVGDPDVITESWSHIEVAKLAPGKATAIAADLEHALWDVRLAVDDYPKMRAIALRIADELAAVSASARHSGAEQGPQLAPGQAASAAEWAAPGSGTGSGPKSAGWVIPASPAESPSEVELLLRWLVDSHFTFLGFREYDLISEADGLALRGVPGTGLGILRHDKTGATKLSVLTEQGRKIA